MNRALVSLALWTLAASVSPAQPPSTARSALYRLETLNWKQIDALERPRTIVLLPVGMLEQHGPHLPVGTDTIGVLYETDAVSKQVRQALTGWNILVMPPINYGHSGANQLGGMRVHPGTYAVRQSTLRSLVADVGAELARNRFQWIFVLNGHGAPTHNIAINQACDFVSETFRVTMLHLTGLFRADPSIQARGEKIKARHFSPSAISSFGMDVHAGVSETAGMLALRPELVDPVYKTLPDRAGRTLDELQQIAAQPSWQGYLSSPSKATRDYGRDIEQWWIAGFTELILRAVRGEDLLHKPRLPETVPPPVAPMLDKTLAGEAAFEANFEKWLAARRNN